MGVRCRVGGGGERREVGVEVEGTGFGRGDEGGRGGGDWFHGGGDWSKQVEMSQWGGA